MAEPQPQPLEIRLATTDFMDHHVATCQDEPCWLCNTYQRTQPQEYEAAIVRWRTRGN
jgi:hypothetical protein